MRVRTVLKAQTVATWSREDGALRRKLPSRSLCRSISVERTNYCISFPSGWPQTIAQVRKPDVDFSGRMRLCLVVRPIGCTAKSSKERLEMVERSEINSGHKQQSRRACQLRAPSELVTSVAFGCLIKLLILERPVRRSRRLISTTCQEDGLCNFTPCCVETGCGKWD